MAPYPPVNPVSAGPDRARITASALSLVLAVFVAACTAPTGGETPGDSPLAPEAYGQTALGGTETADAARPATTNASLTLSVRWPATRTAQLIPEGVRELTCRVVPDEAGVPVERRTIPRLVGSVGQATFYALKPGDWTLVVEGRNVLKELVVSGSTRVRLQPNGRHRAHVVLAPPDQPLTLKRANPLTAFRGEVVTLDGAGFGASRGASYSLTLGDQVIEGEALASRPGEPPLGRASDNTLSFRVPLDATGGSLVLNIEGSTATLPETIEIIASVSVSPQSIYMGIEDTATFSVSFLDAFGQPVGRPPNGLTGALPSYDPDPVQLDCGDDEFFSLTALGAGTQQVSVVDAYKGCLKVARGGFVVGVPPLTATVDIEVAR
ncbi:MAG: hypothetical protein VKO64_12050 [Candidatus Sericytochromatia bacterium]|nr:hypothetical protein [Candidatus Sericytochromatia bacterium]